MKWLLNSTFNPLFVSNDNSSAPGAIQVFAAGATDPAAPLRTIEGPKTLLKNPVQMASKGDELFVVDIAAPPSVHVFKLGDQGDVAPARSISGSINTTLSQPQGIAIVGDELFVGDRYGILVFPIGAKDDVAPTRTIASIGGTTLSYVGQLGTTATADELIFGVGDGLVSFSTTAGSTPPALRTLTPVSLRSPFAVASGGSNLFVAYRDASAGSGIMALSDDATGTGLRNLQGSLTELDRPNGLAVFSGEIFAASTSNGRLLVFNVGDTGNVAPKRKLTLKGAGSEPPNPRSVLILNKPSTELPDRWHF